MRALQVCEKYWTAVWSRSAARADATATRFGSPRWYTDIDALLDRVTVDALLDRITIDRLLERVDMDALLEKVDMNALLDRVDVARLVDRIEVNELVAKVDIDAVLETVDLEAVVRRAGVPEIVQESTYRVAGSVLDMVRRQLAGLDVVTDRVVCRVLRRDPATMPVGPPALNEEAPS